MPTHMPEDILRRFRANDPTVLQELFQQYYLLVCKAICRFIHDQDLMKDLAQNVFVRLWEKRGQLNINSSVPAYLHRMAVNEALGHLRRDWRNDQDAEVPEHSSAGTVEDQFLETELRDHIERAVDSLPPKCKVIFQLSRYEERTYREIAEALDISVKTVENQMGKALRILREQLQEYL
ncbi:MAG: RNA polymerase sigma-70 factor [Saprospiraceae bacterium]|nr:RNA polymerase sigma-70 factor [Saprospiraceae bacterium]MCB0624420.1 RNA polymerase sigma-70 factor [Saprospiraceae bacterium]MCB0677392.1 RNA polymerase sigma-70 factor [Saprospiraceae bacterium]MCB0679661.1 RNA polymerase sigma-70 factor [Saprospiraceae bacterium]